MAQNVQNYIFAKNLRHYLAKFDKTQKEVADAIGVSPQTFNTWTQGIALPRMGKVQALADYFRIGKTDLIDEHTDVAQPPSTDRDPDATAYIEEYKKLDKTDRLIIKSTTDTLLSADKYRQDTQLLSG